MPDPGFYQAEELWDNNRRLALEALELGFLYKVQLAYVELLAQRLEEANALLRRIGNELLPLGGTPSKID